MSLSKKEKARFHEIEATVLDQQHLGLDLLQYETDAGIRSLVRCYDQSMCEAIRSGSDPEFVSNIGNAGMRGLPRAIQWFHDRDSNGASMLVLGGQPARQQASELLKWAIDYDRLYNQHVAFGKCMVDVTIDEGQRIIAFRHSFQVDSKFFVSQQIAMADADARRRAVFPDISGLAANWSKSITELTEAWSANDALLSCSGAIDSVAQWVNDFCLPELDSAQGLGPFSMGSLRRFLAGLFAYSHCHTNIQNGTDLPITVIEKPHAGFVHWLATLTALPEEVIQSIVDIIQYRIERPYVTLGQKPLIRSPISILFSPYIIDGLAPEQLVIGALNASRHTQSAYSSAINMLETVGVSRIAQQLEELMPNTRILRQPSISFSDGKTFTPDIVIYQPSSNQILVADIKYACQPFSTGDVYSDVEEFSEWKTKMLNYVQHVKREPDRVFQLLGVPAHPSPEVVGLICPRWPLPVPVDFALPLAAVDYGSLVSQLRKVKEVPLAEIHSWAANRPDVPVASSVREIRKEIVVADWTYKYSVLIP